MKKLLALSLFLLFLSCKKDKFEIEYSLSTPEGLIHWDILKVEGENSISITDTLRLDVYCPRASSCDYITHMQSDKHGNRILVKAFGNTRENSPCLMFALPQVLKYKFIPNKKGVYILDFIKRDDTTISFTVDVK